MRKVQEGALFGRGRGRLQVSCLRDEGRGRRCVREDRPRPRVSWTGTRAPFLKSDPSLLFSDLNIDVPWKNLVDIVNFPTGPRKLGQPRLVCYMAQPSAMDVDYSYPGLEAPIKPEPMCASVNGIRRRTEERLFGSLDLNYFDSAHINQYRDGDDHVSWHSDEDVELYGEEPDHSVRFAARGRLAERHAGLYVTARSPADPLQAGLRRPLRDVWYITKTLGALPPQKSDDVEDQERGPAHQRDVSARLAGDGADRCATGLL